VKSKHVNKLIRGEVYKEMLRQSEKPEAHVNYMLSTYVDYLSVIREPLVESVVGWILLVIISFPDFPLFFLIALLIILAIIVITLRNMMKILGEVNKLRRKQQNEISKSTQDI
jgi:ABC-type multidrug transport system fused ATPase/permease subunit